MHKISSSTGFNGFGETSWDSGDITDPASKFTIKHVANSFPILDILKLYNINIIKNNKIQCPFPDHSGGREKTPSLVIYPNTNTFHCYGCNAGSTSSDFVAKMDGISVEDAAHKIISIYSDSIDYNVDNLEFGPNVNELYFKFSDYIYNFINENNKNIDAIKYAEDLCSIFDKICDKHKLDGNGIENLICKIKNQLDRFNNFNNLDIFSNLL